MYKKAFLIIVWICISLVAFPQKSNKKITITGTVLDITEKPIVNAIIMIDGQKTNSVTDANGNYKIKVKSDASKIGILTFNNGIREEPIDGKTEINFNFKTVAKQQPPDQSKNEGEEYVNIGYGNVKKKDLINQVGTTDGKENKFAVYNSIYDLIRGELPGVQVNGKGIKIQGGVTSVILSTEPLFIVDGTPISSLDDIQPRMVNSIEVLKGTAASIYGSRGANGVILITLIKGSENK
jgi:TonB-dependent SusC/RagA subfamily outer membrane receptor